MRFRHWPLLACALTAALLLSACGGGGASSGSHSTPPPIVVTVSPATATVNAGLTVQFAATVANSSNTAVTWAVSGGAGNGAISAGGLYTAPATPPSGAVTITATALADASASGTASVTVKPAITVTVSPSTATVNAGLTQQFAATVANTSNGTVTWTVNGGSSNVAISASGLYTAPATPPSGAVTITATSQADTSVSGTASVTVKPAITVTVSPGTATVNVGLTQQFSATVNDSSNQNVTWQVNGGASDGLISAGGLYTAPATPPSGSVTITATSQADTSVSGTASVTVKPAITVTVSPGTATVNAGLTQQFSATVNNSSNQNVTWSVNGGAANGAISASGLYTAPATPPSGAATITATAQAETSVSGTSSVTVEPAITVAVSPGTATVNAGLTQQFSATVNNNSNQNVTWQVNGTTGGNSTNGMISTSGLYTAPPAPPSGAVTVTATSQADTSISGTASVTVAAAITVTVSPGTATVNAGLTQQFTATVANTSNGAVTWTVNGGAANGNITAAGGLYTAPATPPSGAVTITATSQADSNASGTATATIEPAITVTVTGGSGTVNAGLTDQFTATVNNNSNQNVTWQVNGTTGGDSTNGVISTSGLYTAPATPPAGGTVNITATSATGSVISSAYALTVSPAVTVSVSPTSPATVVAGATQAFSATVNNNSNQNVTWEVNGIANGNTSLGTITNAGVYTAPNLVPTGGGVTVSAVAQADSGASASVSVADGWSDASLKGNYVFALQGVDGAGQAIAGLGQFTADGNGTFSGEEDFSGSAFAAATAGNLTGTYSVLPDGRAGVELTTSPEGTSLVFALTLDASGNGRLIEQDTNAAVTGSVWLQSSTATPSGNYVFSAPQEIGGISAAAGAWTGSEDVNNAGVFSSDESVTGTLGSSDSNGRATMSLVNTGGTEDYIYYVVNAGRIELMRSDSGVQAIGRADAQAAGTYDAGAFTGGYVLQGEGTQSASGGGGSLTFSGQLSANGSGGITDGTVDARAGTSNTLGLAISNTSTVTASAGGTGEYTVTLTTSQGTHAYAAWMYSATQGELLEMDSGGGAQGAIAQQQNGPFGVNALLGEFTLQLNGSADGTHAILLQGELTALSGDFAGEADSVISGAVTTNLYLTGSYSVSAGGEATGTLFACTSQPTGPSGCPAGTQTFTTALDFWIGTATNSSTGTASGRAFVGEGDTTGYWQGTLTQQY